MHVKSDMAFIGDNLLSLTLKIVLIYRLPISLW